MIIPLGPALKDLFVELNQVYYSVLGEPLSHFSLFLVVQSTLFFIIDSIKQGLVFVFTFQWLSTTSYLPNLLPKIQDSILNESYVLKNPFLNLFTFLEVPTISNTKFFLGFCNSFFLMLPLSVGHLLTVRRLLLYGIRPGLFSVGGTILGQLCFITSVLFGFRFLVIPWFSNSFIHFFLVFFIFYSVVFDETLSDKVFNFKRQEQPSTLTSFFIDNFILSWAEQASLFQFFRNLTFGAQPTALESFSSNDGLSFLLQTLTYIGGIALGSLFFTCVFGWGIIRFRDFVFSAGNYTFVRVFRTLNYLSALTLHVFLFSSNPFAFYGSDYIATNNLGFLPQAFSLESPSHTLVTSKIIPVNDAVFQSLTDFSMRNHVVRNHDRHTFNSDLTSFDGYSAPALNVKGSRYFTFDELHDKDLNYAGTTYKIEHKQGYRELMADLSKRTLGRQQNTLKERKGPFMKQMFRQENRMSREKAFLKREKKERARSKKEKAGRTNQRITKEALLFFQKNPEKKALLAEQKEAARAKRRKQKEKKKQVLKQREAERAERRKQRKEKKAQVLKQREAERARRRKQRKEKKAQILKKRKTERARRKEQKDKKEEQVLKQDRANKKQQAEQERTEIASNFVNNELFKKRADINYNDHDIYMYLIGCEKKSKKEKKRPFSVIHDLLYKVPTNKYDYKKRFDNKYRQRPFHFLTNFSLEEMPTTVTLSPHHTGRQNFYEFIRRARRFFSSMHKSIRGTEKPKGVRKSPRKTIDFRIKKKKEGRKFKKYRKNSRVRQRPLSLFRKPSATISRQIPLEKKPVDNFGQLLPSGRSFSITKSYDRLINRSIKTRGFLDKEIGKKTDFRYIKPTNNRVRDFKWWFKKYIKTLKRGRAGELERKKMRDDLHYIASHNFINGKKGNYAETMQFLRQKLQKMQEIDKKNIEIERKKRERTDNFKLELKSFLVKPTKIERKRRDRRKRRLLRVLAKNRVKKLKRNDRVVEDIPNLTFLEDYGELLTLQQQLTEEEEELTGEARDVKVYRGAGKSSVRLPIDVLTEQVLHSKIARFSFGEYKKNASISRLREENNYLEKAQQSKLLHILRRARFDIDYLSQPTFQKLTSGQEKRLFIKRQILGSYYNGLRYHNKLPDLKLFQLDGKNLKSEGNKVFNHQFKGSFYSAYIRDDQTSFKQGGARDQFARGLKPVLKYDQPLFLDTKSTKYKKYSPFHEELPYKSQQKKSKKFLEISNSTPFFAGVDPNSGKLLISNQLYPRVNAGYLLNFQPDGRFTTFISSKIKGFPNPEMKKSHKSIKFHLWPINQADKTRNTGSFSLSRLETKNEETFLSKPKVSLFYFPGKKILYPFFFHFPVEERETNWFFKMFRFLSPHKRHTRHNRQIRKREMIMKKPVEQETSSRWFKNHYINIMKRKPFKNPKNKVKRRTGFVQFKPAKLLKKPATSFPPLPMQLEFSKLVEKEKRQLPQSPTTVPANYTTSVFKDVYINYHEELEGRAEEVYIKIDDTPSYRNRLIMEPGKLLLDHGAQNNVMQFTYNSVEPFTKNNRNWPGFLPVKYQLLTKGKSHYFFPDIFMKRDKWLDWWNRIWYRPYHRPNQNYYYNDLF